MTSNHGYILDAAPPPPPKTPGSSESDPKVAEYNRLMELFLAAVEARAKGVDLALYRRLPGLFESVGLTEIGGEATKVLVRWDGRCRPRYTGSDAAPIWPRHRSSRTGGSTG